MAKVTEGQEVMQWIVNEGHFDTLRKKVMEQLKQDGSLRSDVSGMLSTSKALSKVTSADLSSMTAAHKKKLFDEVRKELEKQVAEKAASYAWSHITNEQGEIYNQITNKVHEALCAVYDKKHEDMQAGSYNEHELYQDTIKAMEAKEKQQELEKQKQLQQQQHRSQDRTASRAFTRHGSTSRGGGGQGTGGRQRDHGPGQARSHMTAAPKILTPYGNKPLPPPHMPPVQANPPPGVPPQQRASLPGQPGGFQAPIHAAGYAPPPPQGPPIPGSTGFGAHPAAGPMPAGNPPMYQGPPPPQQGMPAPGQPYTGMYHDPNQGAMPPQQAYGSGLSVYNSDVYAQQQQQAGYVAMSQQPPIPVNPGYQNQQQTGMYGYPPNYHMH